MIEGRNPLLVVTQVTRHNTTKDLLKARTQHATQGVMMINLGLLRSGKLINWWIIERGNPLSPLGQGHTRFNHVSLVDTSTSLLKKKITIERRNPLSALNEEQCHSNSSLETTKQNWNCQWDPDHSWKWLMIRCGKDKKRSSMNVTENDEKHSVIWNWNQRYSWERITQTISIPSRIPKISQWNRCSTYLQNWCPNKMRSMEWIQLIGVILHGNIYLWFEMKKSSVFSEQKSSSFQTLNCALVRYTRTPNLTLDGKTEFKSSPEYRDLDRIDGEPLEFEWNVPRVQHVAAQWGSQKFTVQIGRNTRKFHRKNSINVDVQRHLM